MIESASMFQRKALWIPAALVATALLSAYLLRPVTILDNGAVRHARGAALTTGRALSAVGISLDPADRVEPAAGQLIPLDGQIRIRRAVQV